MSMLRRAAGDYWQSQAYERRRLRLIGEAARGDVLDVGYAQMPNPHLPGPRTTGVDLIPAREPSGYAEEIVGDGGDLASLLGGRRFDTVVAAEIIEHLEDPYGFVRGLRPVIRPGGRLVLSTPNPLGFPVVLLEMMHSRRWFYASDHAFYFLPRWVERLLNDSGFRLLHIQPVGIWLPVGCIPRSPRWLSYQLIYIAEPLP